MQSTRVTRSAAQANWFETKANKKRFYEDLRNALPEDIANRVDGRPTTEVKSRLET
jgi:hypothetical protein